MLCSDTLQPDYTWQRRGPLRADKVFPHDLTFILNKFAAAVVKNSKRCKTLNFPLI